MKQTSWVLTVFIGVSISTTGCLQKSGQFTPSVRLERGMETVPAAVLHQGKPYDPAQHPSSEVQAAPVKVGSNSSEKDNSQNESAVTVTSYKPPTSWAQRYATDLGTRTMPVSPAQFSGGLSHSVVQIPVAPAIVTPSLAPVETPPIVTPGLEPEQAPSNPTPDSKALGYTPPAPETVTPSIEPEAPIVPDSKALGYTPPVPEPVTSSVTPSPTVVPDSKALGYTPPAPTAVTSPVSPTSSAMPDSKALGYTPSIPVTSSVIPPVSVTADSKALGYAPPPPPVIVLPGLLPGYQPFQNLFKAND